MTFLGACCRNQQVKQNGSATTKTKKQNTLQVGFLALVFLFVTLVSTANAQVNSGQANVRLELLSTSGRVANNTGTTAPLANLAIGSHVGLRVSSDNNCYIYIYNQDVSGNLNLLTSPNDNFLGVGQSRTYPDNYSLYEVSGPAGPESIFAIASFRPLSETRLQQLQEQHIQNVQAMFTGNSRGLINGGTGMMVGHAAVQDGWLADSIVFNVVDAAQNVTNTTQHPTYPNQVPAQVPTQIQVPAQVPTQIQVPAHASSTQAPAQVPVLSNYSPSHPVANPAAINSAVTANLTASNLAGSNYTNSGCALANLNLRAPSSSQGFRQRCINKSFDGSFQSTGTMEDIVVHFGTELVSNGFNYVDTTKGELHDFRATFAYQGRSYQMQVEKSGQFFRFELLEFNPQAMNY